MRGDGTIYKRGAKYWIAYWLRGKQYREPAGATAREARDKLRARQADARRGKFIGPEEDRLTVAELLDDLEAHLENKGARSLASVKSHVKPVREFFGSDRAMELGTKRIRLFVGEERRAGKAPATINRRLEVLRQAYRLAFKEDRLTRVPFFPMLAEDNVRRGFFDHADYEAVVAALPEPIDDVVRFAYWSGWRRGDVLGLLWARVDWEAREIRIDRSKNGDGRVIPLEGELWAVIRRRRTAREFETPDGVTRLSPFVFHHEGLQVQDFRRSWATACREAGIPEKLFHDLRRTAVRNMTRAGVDQKVAMDITGHKTISVFLRYNISDERDKREALRKTRTHLTATRSKRKVVPIRRSR